MGLGTGACGYGLCGLDLQTPSGRANRRIPDALEFDGQTRDFVLDDDGNYKGVHPVDAKVFLILRTVAGSIRSSKSTGQTVNAIPYIDQRTIRAEVSDRVRTALADVVAAGEITINKIELDTEVRGRVVFACHYTNLVTARRKTFNAS